MFVYWPPLGGRNHIGLALAGALAYAGWGELEAIAFIDPIAGFKDDPENTIGSVNLQTNPRGQTRNGPTNL